MGEWPRRAGIAAAVATAVAAGLCLLGYAPWPGASHAVDLPVFLAVVLGAAVGPLIDWRHFGAPDLASVRAFFVAEFGALVLLGAVPMSIVAVVAAAVRAHSEAHRSHEGWRASVDIVSAVVATQLAGLIYGSIAGSEGPLDWPWRALPIAVAVLAYTLVRSAAADFAIPFVTGDTIDAQWPAALLRRAGAHVIWSGAAASLAEAVHLRAWDVVAVAAVPLCLAWLTWRRYAEELTRRHRRAGLTASPEHGVALLDDDGRITSWSHELWTMLECPPEFAIGRTIADAVPPLARTDVPRAVHEALTGRTVRTLAQVPFRSQRHTRVLTLTMVPDSDGVALVWRDITAQADTERTLRQSADRLSLVAAGANDGLWELDDRGQLLYVSDRWRTILGIPESQASVRADDWFSRVHPDDLASLKDAIEAHVGGRSDCIEHEHRIRHKDNTYRRVLCRGVAVRDGHGRHIRMAGSLTDLTVHTVTQERILNAGIRDPLTGLCNRAAFVEALGRRLEDLKRRRGRRFAVLYLDLDRFKVVNDSLGHMIGDELLVAVSRRLENCLREGDEIARLGGDEFAILLLALEDEMQANVIAFRIQDSLGTPFAIGGREVVTSASIGIAFSRQEYANPEEIMRDADTAMYHAKAHGKARHELFDAAMHARAIDRLGLESDLRNAVKSSGFEVHYQPIVSLTTRLCTGFESLVRWNRNGKPVSPSDFVPMAEELGLIEPLGTWVLQQACRTFADWQRRFPAVGLECITVNVSTRQLMQQGFMYLVERTVEQSGLAPGDLRLEITETALMDAPQMAAKVLAELREFGVKIYLDDFGTGYSSLSHLHKLPVDALKIDRSFVRGLLMDERPAIVESILALARTMQTSVIAEGIEDELQARELERLGCRHAQGYYFSRPIPAREVEEILAAGVPLGGPRSELTLVRGIA